MVKQRDRVTMTPDEVAAMLAGCRKVQLATINPDGMPHLVTMYYTLVDGKIAFWTYRTSQKALNLARDPRISCLVETGDQYFDLKGVQIQGVVQTIEDPAAVQDIGRGITEVIGTDIARRRGRCAARLRGASRPQALRLHRRTGPGDLLGPQQAAAGIRVPHRGDDEFACRGSFHLVEIRIREAAMDFKLELVIIPVTDMDRAKDFYTERAGFRLDVDHRAGEDFRIVQLTPPGSACSITLMRNPEAAGSVQGLHLIVTDIDEARAELTGPRGRRLAISPLRRRRPDARTRPAAGQVQLVPVLHRPGRQRLAGAGGQAGIPARTMTGHEADRLVAAAVAGNELAFGELTRRHRRELHVHCYRMLASFDDAEDAVQETLLRAWRGRAGFAAGAQFRAWLYRIATNVCLDVLRSRSRQARPLCPSPSCRGCSPILMSFLIRRRPPPSSQKRSSWGARPSSWRSSPRCRCCRRGSAPR